MEVERERRVAGEVLLRNGHMERDCLRRDSMVVEWVVELLDPFWVLSQRGVLCKRQEGDMKRWSDGLMDYYGIQLRLSVAARAHVGKDGGVLIIYRLVTTIWGGHSSGRCINQSKSP